MTTSKRPTILQAIVRSSGLYIYVYIYIYIYTHEHMFQVCKNLLSGTTTLLINRADKALSIVSVLD